LGNIQNVFEISTGKHVMLLYETEEDRAKAASDWINQALEEDQLCIYASVYAFEDPHISNISSLSNRINNYQEHTENNNLQIINFRTYYESALSRNLELFVNLKTNLEKLLHDLVVKGKTDKIIVFADAACCLCENRSFGESVLLEEWWQQVHDEWVKKNYHITVICPHPKQVLKSNQSPKSKIECLHDLILDLDKYNHYSNTSIGQEYGIRILIVESDSDLKTLYTEFFGDRFIDVITASDGNECLSLVKTINFDIIILDTHIAGDEEPADIAKEIHRIKPEQRIVLTTTNPVYLTSSATNCFGVNKEDILVKPFMLSDLLEVIRRK
jgi:CheY-like chemotaxis protein